MSLAGTVPALVRLGPFDAVHDVGGNVGEWAGLARSLWPDARLTSFEPVPFLAELNRERAGGRWWVEEVGISDHSRGAYLSVCTNQHSVSTMQAVGTVRRQAFGIQDRWEAIRVDTRPLDAYLSGLPDGRLLVKIDVEGHEGFVLAGATDTLRRADAVIVECQQSPDVFDGAPSPAAVDELMQLAGLRFSGVLDSLSTPAGELVQFDGLWLRDR